MEKVAEEGEMETVEIMQDFEILGKTNVEIQKIKKESVNQGYPEPKF